MKKIFCLFMVCFLSSCSILETEYSSQNLTINFWESCVFEIWEHGSSGRTYHLGEETDVRYFDVQKIDGDIYISYILGEIKVTEVDEEELVLSEGEVEIRVIKGTYDSYGFTWDLLFAYPVVGDNDTRVTTFSLNGEKALAINNNNIVSVYQLSSTDPRVVATLNLNLFLGYSQIGEINTWIDSSGTTYLAAVANGSRIIVGKFDSAHNWSIQSNYDLGYNITNFDVKMGLNYPYAIWEQEASQKLYIATYNYVNTSKNPWTVLNTLKNVTAPTLLVEAYNSPYTGRLKEDVFVGTVNVFRKEFQIYTLNANNQLSYTGAYVTGDNTDNSIASNKLSQILFVRPTMEYPNYYPISATLNSQIEWSDIVAPRSEMEYIEGIKIETLFMNDSTPVMIYRKENGILLPFIGK